MRCENMVVLAGAVEGRPTVTIDARGRKIAAFVLLEVRRLRPGQAGEERREVRHRVKVMTAQASAVARRAREGSWVYVRGSLSYRTWRQRGGAEAVVAEVLVAGHGDRVLLDPAGNDPAGNGTD